MGDPPPDVQRPRHHTCPHQQESVTYTTSCTRMVKCIRMGPPRRTASPTPHLSPSTGECYIHHIMYTYGKVYQNGAPPDVQRPRHHTCPHQQESVTYTTSCTRMVKCIRMGDPPRRTASPTPHLSPSTGKCYIHHIMYTYGKVYQNGGPPPDVQRPRHHTCPHQQESVTYTTSCTRMVKCIRMGPPPTYSVPDTTPVPINRRVLHTPHHVHVW